MEDGTRSRAWCFTLNNPTDEEKKYIKENDLKKFSYVIVGQEQGESGTPHLQGYIEYKDQKTFMVMKKILPRCHLESRKGTALQNKTYCSKEGNLLREEGVISKQGKRNDLEEIKALAQNGAGMREILEIATNVQSVKMAETYLKYYEKPRNWKPEVKWYWGKTGSGKSRSAHDEMPDAYICMETGRWWEGYDAHEDIIIDDMRGDFCKFHVLLKLLDRYEFRIECKNGSRQLLAKRIIITSSQSPEQMWNGRTSEDIGQLLRRIDEIKEF